MANAIDNLKRNLRLQAEQSKLYQSANNWYGQLVERDQLIVKILSVCILMALIFAWIWLPVSNGQAKAIASYNTEMKFHAKMKESAYLFSSGDVLNENSEGSILSTVNNTAKVKNILLKRFEPDGKTGLRIWLDQVNFNSVIDWLELLETSRGIRVEQISIDRVAPGIVNVRAVLQS